jgi:hypothetical protein
MGSRTTTTLFDDLDGSTEGVRTVTIGLDRQSVELDLSEANYGKVRDFLTPYLDAGRKTNTTTGTSRKSGTTAADKRADTQAIREWAEANGHKVNTRGRIKKEIVDAYQAANA